MFNEVLLLQLILIILAVLFILSTNNLIMWYLIGLILVILGFLMFLDNSDIFVGFLWLIDLGLGVVFLIFIFHFSNFLYKKIHLKLNFFKKIIALLILVFYISLVSGNDSNYAYSLHSFGQFMPFNVTLYDYYSIFNSPFKTDLNILREMYFFNNSLEFIIINMVILYGVIQSIVFFFILKKFFAFLNFSLLDYVNFFKFKLNFFYIRNQNLINQQDEGSNLKVWSKTKNDTKKNFFKNFR